MGCGKIRLLIIGYRHTLAARSLAEMTIEKKENTMQDITLKDCLTEWPLTNGSAVEDSPTPEDGDLIKRASLSGNDFLKLTLQRNNRSFVSSVSVRKDRTQMVASVVKDLKGKTIVQAALMVLGRG